MEWTEQRIEILRKLWGQGQTASQIAALLGGISRNAVIGKAHRLGLTGRPSPIKREAGAPKRRSRASQPQAPMQPSLQAMPGNRTPSHAMAEENAMRPTSGRQTAGRESEAAGSAAVQASASPTRPAAQPSKHAGTKTCSWPVGDPKQVGFHFCGEPSELGRPYCAHHCAIAYHRKTEAA